MRVERICWSRPIQVGSATSCLRARLALWELKSSSPMDWLSETYLQCSSSRLIFVRGVVIEYK